MQNTPGFVIVGSDGTEHQFPAGMDPKKAAAIVRQSEAASAPPPAPAFNAPRIAQGRGTQIDLSGKKPCRESPDVSE